MAKYDWSQQHHAVARRMTFLSNRKPTRPLRPRRYAVMVLGLCLVGMTLFNAFLLQHAQWHHHIMANEPSSTLNDPSLLWNTSDTADTLPLWFQDYASWHRDTRKQLHDTNWKQFRYLLVRCVARDRTCGGAADRLSPMPAIFYLGYVSRRLVFIYWTRPAPLERFLRPHFMDWRLPKFLVPLLHADAPTHPWTFQRSQLVDGSWEQKSDRVIAVKTLYHGLAEYYDSVERTPLAQSYHAIWNAIFQPSVPVLRYIQSTMDDLQLVDQQYVGLHIRSLYQINATLRDLELRNAVTCAGSISQNTTIFVAADVPSSARYAVQYGRQLGYNIVHRTFATPPLHLDRGRDFLHVSNDWKHHRAEDYYDVFVDLYLLAASNHVSAGVGGFGVWAGQIGPRGGVIQRDDAKAACVKAKE